MFGLDVTEDGSSVKLNDVISFNSGGENQVPFYIVVAASLLECYSYTKATFNKDVADSNSIRLIIVDESFDKMDRNNIKSIIEFLKDKLNFQCILSAPTEKFNSIGTNLDNIVLVTTRKRCRASVSWEKTAFVKALEEHIIDIDEVDDEDNEQDEL